MKQQPMKRTITFCVIRSDPPSVEMQVNSACKTFFLSNFQLVDLEPTLAGEVKSYNLILQWRDFSRPLQDVVWVTDYCFTISGRTSTVHLFSQQLRVDSIINLVHFGARKVAMIEVAVKRLGMISAPASTFQILIV